MIAASKPAREHSASRRASFTTIACIATAAAVSSLVCACGDEAPIDAAPQVEAPAAKPELHKAAWLRLTDGIAPQQWLASREAGRDLDPYEPAVADMAKVLDVAAQRFRDQPRMIANRAVQLEGMLSEKRISERAPRLIVTLSQVPGTHRSVESFASLTQQYYNLRVEGLGQGQAIDALKHQNRPNPPENDAR
jgi:hypothetical protein